MVAGVTLYLLIHKIIQIQTSNYSNRLRAIKKIQEAQEFIKSASLVAQHNRIVKMIRQLLENEQKLRFITNQKQGQ